LYTHREHRSWNVGLLDYDGYRLVTTDLEGGN